jgi:hypothetical protein
MKDVALKLLYLLISGLVVRLFYGIFIAHHEPVLKGYLTRISSERARRKFIRAFVAALRGRADRNDATIKTHFIAFAATLVTVLCVSVAIFSFQTVDTSRATLTEMDKQGDRLFELRERIEKGLARNAEAREQLNEPEKSLSELPPSTIADEMAKTAEKLAAQKEELAAVLEDLKIRRERVVAAVEKAEYARISSVAVAAFFAILAFYLVVIWAPTMYATRVFAFEITRFMNRIQSIATPAEVGDLACAEVQVDDEPSLRKFVELAGTIARAHDVEMLAKRFDIWDVVGPEEKKARGTA